MPALMHLFEHFIPLYLLLLLAVILLFLLTGLFIRKEWTASEVLVIDIPVLRVYQYVRQLRNHYSFNQWISLNCRDIPELKGPDGQAGAEAIFEGKGSSNNKTVIAISNLVEGFWIDFEIRSQGSAVEKIRIVTQSVNDIHTQISLLYSFRSRYPFNVFTAVSGHNHTMNRNARQSLVRLNKALKNTKEPVMT
ncbi:MAG: hypothetical protein V4450_16145 [Bacteroidota bacterium]